MSTTRTPFGDTYHPLAAKGRGVSGSRARLAGLLLSLAAVGVLAVGGWGLLSSLATPAGIGESVAVPGGLLRVDGVAPESMAPMQAGKYSASGMNMSATGMDMAPEGRRRFSVEVTLAAGERAFGYSPRDFRVAGRGMEAVGPLRSQLEAGTVPPGGAISGSLLFQVPDAAEGLVLSFEGGRSISLGPGGVPGDGHDH